MNSIVENIQKSLNDNHIYGDVYNDGKIIKVEINWGDWKHEHLATRWIIESMYKVLLHGETITEEDGSDCYSAVHTFLLEGVN